MKNYAKCYVVGNDESQVIVEMDYMYQTHFDKYTLYHYYKGKDLVSGTPVILTYESKCNENNFDEDIRMYGLSRLNRLGITDKPEKITKQTAINILKAMTEEDINNYLKNIEMAKEKHAEMVKNYFKQIFGKYQSKIQENKELRLQRNRIKKLNNNHDEKKNIIGE